MSLPVRFLYSTQAGCGRATQTVLPSTRNFTSTASACRVAIATISAWYTQCTGFLVQRSVAVKSSNMASQTITDAGGGSKSGGRLDASQLCLGLAPRDCPDNEKRLFS